MVNSEGVRQWLYGRSNGVILDVFFDDNGKVIKTSTRKGRIGGGGGTTVTTNAGAAKKTPMSRRQMSGGRSMGTPLR